MDDDQADESRTGDGAGLELSAQERSSRLTTTIPRPVNRRASDAGQSRLSVRRRGPKPDRISSRRSAWLFGLGALAVAGSIAAALFVLPVRTWFDQTNQLSALENELSEVQAVNDDLGDEVARLQTDEGIREAAREELGQVELGDRRITLLEPPALPRNLPAGWPYAQVDQILTMRTATPTTSPSSPDASGDFGGFQPVTIVPAPSTAAPVPPTAAPTTSPTTTIATGG